MQTLVRVSSPPGHGNRGATDGVNALDCGPTAKILRYPYGERGRSGTPYKDIEGDTTSV